MCQKKILLHSRERTGFFSSSEVVPERWQVFFVCSVFTSKTLGLSMSAGPPYMMLFLWTETNPPGTKSLKFWVGYLRKGKREKEALLQNFLLNHHWIAKHQITYLYHFILINSLERARGLFISFLIHIFIGTISILLNGTQLNYLSFINEIKKKDTHCYIPYLAHSLISDRIPTKYLD